MVTTWVGSELSKQYMFSTVAVGRQPDFGTVPGPVDAAADLVEAVAALAEVAVADFANAAGTVRTSTDR